MNFLFLFMDGVGLGENNAEVNPLAKAKMPNLSQLLGGNKLVEGSAPIETERASLRALDANLGMEGLPQSATGQAALMTGVNVPREIGEHYGPKPNPPVAEIVRNGNLFHTLKEKGYEAALLNAYPSRYFEAIDSGRRLYSAIPLAVTSAGLQLKNDRDLYAGEAMSVDFTGRGWREFLGYSDAPLMTLDEAGRQLAKLAMSYDFALFEYWPSDYAGHRQDMGGAVELLEAFDQALGGVLTEWEDEAGLILITSDHGNMEDMGTRRHTSNAVPGLVIGAPKLREKFTADLEDLSHVTPVILRMYA